MLQELIEKFDLQQWEYEPLLFAETIVPVYDVRNHLEKWVSKTETKTITGLGSFLFYTVPKDEIWNIRTMAMQKIGGDFGWQYVMIDRGPFEVPMIVEDTAITSMYTTYRLEQDLILQPNDGVKISITEHATDGDLKLLLDLKIEKIR